MSKVGRNDPCPCGSGEKFKRCCAVQEAAAANERFLAEKVKRAEAAAAERAQRGELSAFIEERALLDEEAEQLTEESNVVIELLDAGRLDEAEAAAKALLERYPQVHDGLDRMGMVCEKRGDIAGAIEWYRKCIAFIGENAELYDEEFAGVFEKLIAKLEASGGR